LSLFSSLPDKAFFRAVLSPSAPLFRLPVSTPYPPLFCSRPKIRPLPAHFACSASSTVREYLFSLNLCSWPQPPRNTNLPLFPYPRLFLSPRRAARFELRPALLEQAPSLFRLLDALLFCRNTIDEFPSLIELILPCLLVYPCDSSWRVRPR